MKHTITINQKSAIEHVIYLDNHLPDNKKTTHKHGIQNTQHTPIHHNHQDTKQTNNTKNKTKKTKT
jgi:hypothetical protein